MNTPYDPSGNGEQWQPNANNQQPPPWQGTPPGQAPGNPAGNPVGPSQPMPAWQGRPGQQPPSVPFGAQDPRNDRAGGHGQQWAQSAPAGASQQQAPPGWGGQQQAPGPYQGNPYPPPSAAPQQWYTNTPGAAPAGTAPFAGQQFPGQQATAWGSGDSFAAAHSSPGPLRNKWVLIGAGAGLVLVLLALTAFVWPGWANEKHFDQASLQSGVRGVVTNTFRIPDVGDVRCPDSAQVEVGNTFDCTVMSGQDTKRVQITVKSEDGEYEVSQPR